MTSNMLVLLFIATAALMSSTDAACTFPSTLTAGASWTSSRLGTGVTFNDTHMTATFEFLGSVTLECDTASGSTYLLRSAEMAVMTLQVEVCMCIDITVLSDYSVLYYHGTTEQDFTPNAPNSEAPILLQAAGTVLSVTTLCTALTKEVGTNDMLVLTGSERSAAVQCPDPFLATFHNYTVDGSLPAGCTEAYTSVCSDYKTVAVDQALCTQTTFYSTAGDLICLYSAMNGSNTYLNLYNFDTSITSGTNARFSCVSMAYGTGDWSIEATQKDNKCHYGQTPTSVTSGNVLLLNSNLTCIPSASTAASTSSSPVGIIVGVLFAIIIIVLIALFVYFCIIRGRWATFKQKLPCFKGKSKGQVDPMMDDKKSENGISLAPTMAPAVVTTAVLTPSDEKVIAERMVSSQSTRSVATPSHLQAEIKSEPDFVADAAGEPTGNHKPQGRLPPLEASGTPRSSELVEGGAASVVHVEEG